jgi:hypothetical protein
VPVSESSVDVEEEDEGLVIERWSPPLAPNPSPTLLLPPPPSPPLPRPPPLSVVLARRLSSAARLEGPQSPLLIAKPLLLPGPRLLPPLLVL